MSRKSWDRYLRIEDMSACSSGAMRVFGAVNGAIQNPKRQGKISVPEIARKICRDTRTVYRGLAELKQAGILLSGLPKPGATAVYQFTFEYAGPPDKNGRRPRDKNGTGSHACINNARANADKTFETVKAAASTNSVPDPLPDAAHSVESAEAIKTVPGFHAGDQPESKFINAVTSGFAGGTPEECESTHSRADSNCSYISSHIAESLIAATRDSARESLNTSDAAREISASVDSRAASRRSPNASRTANSRGVSSAPRNWSPATSAQEVNPEVLYFFNLLIAIGIANWLACKLLRPLAPDDARELYCRLQRDLASGRIERPAGYARAMLENASAYLPSRALLPHAHTSREISQTHAPPCLRCGRPFIVGQGWMDGCHLDPDCALINSNL